MRRATIEEIAGLKGFNRKMAEDVLSSLKQGKDTDTMKIYISGSMAYDRIMDFPGNLQIIYSRTRSMS
jgi:hypothetical protein